MRLRNNVFWFSCSCTYESRWIGTEEMWGGEDGVFVVFGRSFVFCIYG